ncbi:MAG: metal-dependent transcriptional regulator [Candidatus Lokiarchaeota archaeon]|nr:metal-dependent transcriptional regulator [Candidatus Lokiarchaeota archaeon]
MERFSESIEDYLKAIYIISKKKRGGWVCNNEIACFLKVKPASVSTMLHKLKEIDLIQWKPRSSLRLKPKGKNIAQELVQNYNNLFFFFKKVLGVKDKSLLKQICCKIEHILPSDASNALLELDSF